MAILLCLDDSFPNARMVDNGITLFIAVDCGITAIDQVEHARGLNLDVIICDHHEPSEVLPNAYAVLDPIKPGDKYPFKHLSGCGVGFKLIQAIAQRLNRESLLPEYLDFVTLATTADIVPLAAFFFAALSPETIPALLQSSVKTWPQLNVP